MTTTTRSLLEAARQAASKARAENEERYQQRRVEEKARGRNALAHALARLDPALFSELQNDCVARLPGLGSLTWLDSGSDALAVPERHEFGVWLFQLEEAPLLALARRTNVSHLEIGGSLTMWNACEVCGAWAPLSSAPVDSLAALGELLQELESFEAEEQRCLACAPFGSRPEDSEAE